MISREYFLFKKKNYERLLGAIISDKREMSYGVIQKLAGSKFMDSESFLALVDHSIKKKRFSVIHPLLFGSKRIKKEWLVELIMTRTNLDPYIEGKVQKAINDFE